MAGKVRVIKTGGSRRVTKTGGSRRVTSPIPVIVASATTERGPFLVNTGTLGQRGT